jgi:hypothetical protein
MVLEPDDSCRLRLVRPEDEANPGNCSFHWFLTHLRHFETGLTMFSGSNGEVFLDSLQSMAGKLLSIQLEPEAGAPQAEKGFGRGYLRVMVDNEPMYFNIHRSHSGTTLQLVAKSHRNSVFDLQSLAPPAPAPAMAQAQAQRVPAPVASPVQSPPEEQKAEQRPGLKRLETASISEDNPFYLQCVATGDFIGPGARIKHSSESGHEKCREAVLVPHYYDAMQFVFKGPRIEQAFGHLVVSTRVEGQTRKMILAPKDNQAGMAEMSDSWFEYTKNHRIRMLTEETFADVKNKQIVFEPGAGMEFQLVRF